MSTLQGTDVFLDASTTDEDVLEAQLNGASGTFTAQNIEIIKAQFVSGAPALQLDNVAGVKQVVASGAVAGTVNGFNASTVQPTFKSNSFTNTLTIAPTSLAGTTAAGTAETVNVEVAGASFGTTAATQSAIVINGGAGTLETLNLTSTGDAANTFSLAVAGGSTLGTVNVKGTADANIRVAHADVTGITLKAGDNTGNTNVIIDRNGATTASTNLTNFTGVEKFTFRDSVAAGDALVATNIAAGAAVDVVSNFATGSTFSVNGAATNTADALTLTLDHAAPTTGVTITDLNVQNVETLNIVSNGNSAATLAGANGNVIGTGAANELVGDFTKIVITGDTAFTANIDVDAPAAGNMVTVVDASGMTGTAAVNLSAANDANAANRYSITGTANNDTLAGGAGNDTIVAGAGNDTITMTVGQDTLTGGEGRDTFVTSAGVMGSTDTAVSTLTDFTTGAATTADVMQVASGSVGAGGVYIGSAAGLTAATAYSVIVLTDAAYANAAAASAAINVTSTSATAAVVVYLNSSTGFAQAYLDDLLGTDAVAATNTDFAVFQNITTLVGVSGFDAANFTVV